MINGDLATTNLMLAIIAAVSALYGLALIGAGIFGYRAYRSAMQAIRELEQRQIAPLAGRIDQILADVKEITARVSHGTERVDQAISETMGRVDETAARVTGSVRGKATQAVGVVRGVRAAIVTLLNGGRQPPQSAPGPA